MQVTLLDPAQHGTVGRRDVPEEIAETRRQDDRDRLRHYSAAVAEPALPSCEPIYRPSRRASGHGLSRASVCVDA